jgi:hypothetical protein
MLGGKVVTEAVPLQVSSLEGDLPPLGDFL